MKATIPRLELSMEDLDKLVERAPPAAERERMRAAARGAELVGLEVDRIHQREGHSISCRQGKSPAPRRAWQRAQYGNPNERPRPINVTMKNPYHMRYIHGTIF